MAYDFLQAHASEGHYAPTGSHTGGATGSTIVPLSPPNDARWLIIQAFTQNIRLTLDGTTQPSATVGFQIRAGDPAVRIPVNSGVVIRYIEEASGAVVQWQFVK